ncbi:MAG: small multi-drug export protein [Thermoplasmata archaeon]|nr:small multi-drug export protein [Thermoplasmata archaeon]
MKKKGKIQKQNMITILLGKRIMLRNIQSFFCKKNVISRVKLLVVFVSIVAVGALLFLTILNLLTPDQQKWYSALSLAYFLPPAGKETVIPLGLSQGLPILPWCITLFFFDFLVCVAFLTNWWILEFLIAYIPPFPFVGIKRQKPHFYKKKISLKLWYEKLHKKTKEIEAKKYGKLLPIALFFFMLVPFQGTGAMSTTIIGEWLGLRQRETLIIVSIGSFLSILLVVAIYLGIVEIWG